MPTEDTPQIYLITPPQIELSQFPQTLSHVLDSTEIACLRLSLATRDEDTLTRAADAVRDVAHRYDVALVLDTHVVLAQRLGLDGVHLTDGARSVRSARRELGADAIVGAYCAASRHDGMTAGEAGADYVSFGPLTATALGDGTVAEPDLFTWWTEMIELPVVAEGGLTVETILHLASQTDFFAIGDEIWSADDPAEALKSLTKALSA